MFILNARLKEDAAEVTELGLSLVLLKNDSSFPWIILVPKRAGVREIYELSPPDRITLIEEITLASKAIVGLYSPDKINIGALGNIVPDLHVHVIGRFKTDRAWPGPVWSAGQGAPYTKEGLKKAIALLSDALLRKG